MGVPSSAAACGVALARVLRRKRQPSHPIARPGVAAIIAPFPTNPHGEGAMSETITPATYRSYRGLPTLAGLATLEEAARPGLSIEACVARLKRYHYAFLRLHEIFTARITAEPIYELKTGFAHHAYPCAEHAPAFPTPAAQLP